MAGSFKGPIFIVGMSRSGTKLLRDILNNNEKIGIPSYESHLIPYLIKKFTGRFPLNKKDSKHFKKVVASSIFYNEIIKKYDNFNGIDFEALAKEKDIQTAIAHMMIALTPQKKKIAIWGDKTPNNMLYIAMLKEVFPDAKFIHIIRDPRERALSTKMAWGTDILSSAERWRSGVVTARKQGQLIKRDYLEISYEGLTTRPEVEIKRVCRFIGISYVQSMSQLGESAEVYKTAKNNTITARTIVGGNVEKYKKLLSNKEIAQIEKICGDVLEEFGYERAGALMNDVAVRRRKLIKLRDALMTASFHINRWGLLRGCRYIFWRRKVSSVKFDLPAFNNDI